MSSNVYSVKVIWQDGTEADYTNLLKPRINEHIVILTSVSTLVRHYINMNFARSVSIVEG